MFFENIYFLLRLILELLIIYFLNGIFVDLMDIDHEPFLQFQSIYLDQYYYIIHHKKYRNNLNILDHTTDKMKGTFTQ